MLRAAKVWRYGSQQDAKGRNRRNLGSFKPSFRHVFVLLSMLIPVVFAGGAVLLTCPAHALAQVAAHQVGTVTSVTGSTLTLKASTGAETTVSVDAAAKVLSLPAGSKNLQAATPATLADIAVGDRVLATGAAGSTPGTLTASRIVLMKADDIAAMNATQQADWQKNGVSGLVRTVDGPVLTIAATGRTIKVETTPATKFKRYAAGSVSFRAASPSTLAEIHAGDQLSVRGQKSADGMEIAAEEVVAGTFDNLSGEIASINPEAQTLTLKDLATKKTVTVQIAPTSDLRSLPAEAAHAFAERSQGEAPATAGKTSAGSNAPAAGETAGASQGSDRRRAGMDLSRMLARLPQQKLADLKVGDAVMIVASQLNGEGPLTAITMLSGVEPLLKAKSQGANPITLSPWDLDAPGGGL